MGLPYVLLSGRVFFFDPKISGRLFSFNLYKCPAFLLFAISYASAYFNGSKMQKSTTVLKKYIISILYHHCPDQNMKHMISGLDIRIVSENVGAKILTR